MFEKLEEAVKRNSDSHERTADDLARIEHKLETKSTQTHNCLLGIWIFLLVNMFMTGAAITYAYEMKKQAEGAKEQIEKLNQSADRFEKLADKFK